MASAPSQWRGKEQQASPLPDVYLWFLKLPGSRNPIGNEWMHVLTPVLKSVRWWISPFYPSSCEQTQGQVLPVLWAGSAGFGFVSLLGVVAAQSAEGFVLFLCPEAYAYACLPHKL